MPNKKKDLVKKALAAIRADDLELMEQERVLKDAIRDNDISLANSLFNHLTVYLKAAKVRLTEIKKCLDKKKLKNKNNKKFVDDLCKSLKNELNRYVEINSFLETLEYTGDSRNKLVWQAISKTLVEISISQKYHSSHYVSKANALDLSFLFGILLMSEPDKQDRGV
mgnify:CR=1 FL=1